GSGEGLEAHWEDGHREAHDGSRVAPVLDGPALREALGEVVCAGLALPPAGGDVVADPPVADAADGDGRAVGEDVAPVGGRTEEADAGDDLVPAPSKRADDRLRVSGVPGLTDEAAVLDDHGVCGDHDGLTGGRRTRGRTG